MTQRVVIDKRWTYVWHGETPLEVGERVFLPASAYSYEPWAGTVTSVTSDYAGPARSVVCRVSNRK